MLDTRQRYNAGYLSLGQKGNQERSKFMEIWGDLSNLEFQQPNVSRSPARRWLIGMSLDYFYENPTHYGSVTS